MKKQHLFAAGVAALNFASALPAAAQSIDYGALEQVFSEPVTTSATGSPQRASEAPVDMDIISAADIKRSGATDLPTILSRVAGLDVLTWGAGAADIGVRGYNAAQSPRLLVLVNGRQVYLDFYAYTAWSTLPVRLEEIRQIEVIKGPNAALFGFNAVSGVINIITYNPKYDAKGFASGVVGSEGYREASLGHTIQLGDRFAARLTGGFSRQHEFKDTLGAGILYQPVERATANFDTVTQLADKLQLRLEGGWSHARQNEFASIALPMAVKYLVTDVKGALDWETPAGAVQLQAYQNRVSQKSKAFQPISNKISVISAQDLFKVGPKHTFRVSAEYRKTSVPLNGGGDFAYEVKSASAMWHWEALDKLRLTAAGRYDDLRMWRTGAVPDGLPVTNSFFARRITLPSYNAGIVWSPTDLDTFRATYARGAQIPSLTALSFQTVAAPGVLLMGNALLQPTVVTNYGVSYDRAIPQIHGGASLRLFYQKSRGIVGQPDFSSPDFVLPPVIFTSFNVSDSDLRGVEASAKGAYASGVRWTANYAYTDVEDHPRGAFDLAARKADFAATTPKHRANLNLGWDRGAWTIDGFVRVQSKMAGYAPLPGGLSAVTTIGAYASLAGRVAYTFDHGLTVALSGQNLGANRQRQTSGLEVERRVFLTLSKTW